MGAVIISVILIMLLFQIFNKVQSVLVVSQNRARVMEQGRNALDILAQDFRSLGAASVWDPVTHGEMKNIKWVKKVSLPTLLSSIVYESQPLISPMEDTDPDWPSYRDRGHALEVHWHQCKFFTNDEGWRFVDYKFGGRNHYTTMNPASPVGALWVYRSRGVRRSGLEREQVDHDTLKLHDPLPPNYEDPSYDPGSDSREQDGLVGYSRVVDGVIHFRVRAVSPLDPGGAFASPASSFYTGGHAPSLVEVEIAVVDENLVAEMEAGIEQRMEGQAAPVKFQEKLNYIKKNLDRVYFFKQLINIQGKGQ